MKAITIIGGGLAGLTLANALQREGVPVTLYEAGSLPRHRVCGEFICGRGHDVLHNLGMGDALAGAARHTTTHWSVQGRTVLEHDLPAPAYGLSRFCLDQRLADSFQALGGQLQLLQRKPMPESAEGVVLCKGRRPNTRSPWIGLKIHCTGLTTAADLELHLGRGGYVGLSTVENGRVNVCGLFKQHPGLRAKRASYLLEYLRHCGLEAIAERIQAARIVEDSYSGVAGVEFSKIPAADEAALSLGDAYSAMPPFTGNGMSLAMESAELAVPFVARYARGEGAWADTLQAVNTALHTRFDQRLRNARQLHPWLHHPLGQHLLSFLARAHLLPFNQLYSRTH
jgi:flavin-dependent dehydrogenase